MKVVINKRWGGFSLSAKAIKRLAELQGKQCYFFDITNIGKYIPISLEKTKDVSFWMVCDIPNPHDLDHKERNKHILYFGNINRNDPLLIQVVEELGIEANGDHANLKIVEIPDNILWEVKDYDGMESVEEVHRSWR